MLEGHPQVRKPSKFTIQFDFFPADCTTSSLAVGASLDSEKSNLEKQGERVSDR